MIKKVEVSIVVKQNNKCTDHRHTKLKNTKYQVVADVASSLLFREAIHLIIKQISVCLTSVGIKTWTNAFRLLTNISVEEMLMHVDKKMVLVIALRLLERAVRDS